MGFNVFFDWTRCFAHSTPSGSGVFVANYFYKHVTPQGSGFAVSK
jgi:hypothetical protein